MNYIKAFFLLSGIMTAANLSAEDNETVNKHVSFKSKERGGYESSAVTETVTRQGTSEITATKENVEIDTTGNVKGSLKTERRVNPAGLMNETWKQEEATNVIKSDGSSELQARARELSEDGTVTETKLNSVSVVRQNGGTEITSDLKTTVDPKGIMNKSVTETKKIISKNAGGSGMEVTEKTVDGKVVE